MGKLDHSNVHLSRTGSAVWKVVSVGVYVYEGHVPGVVQCHSVPATTEEVHSSAVGEPAC